MQFHFQNSFKNEDPTFSPSPPQATSVTDNLFPAPIQRFWRNMKDEDEHPKMASVTKCTPHLKSSKPVEG